MGNGKPSENLAYLLNSKKYDEKQSHDHQNFVN